MASNNFDISNITDIQGGTYNYGDGTGYNDDKTQGYFNLIDQNDQSFNFEIVKNNDKTYSIKYNNEEIGMLYPGTRKIVLGDKEFSMLSVFQLDGDNKNVATLLKPEDLNIGSVLDIPLTTTENYFNIYFL